MSIITIDVSGNMEALGQAISFYFPTVDEESKVKLLKRAITAVNEYPEQLSSHQDAVARMLLDFKTNIPVTFTSDKEEFLNSDKEAEKFINIDDTDETFKILAEGIALGSWTDLVVDIYSNIRYDLNNGKSVVMFKNIDTDFNLILEVQPNEDNSDRGDLSVR